MSHSIPLHVAAAAIFDRQGRVLITRRPQQVHQGGLWEFPGGKVEAGESVQQALERELHEEIGIDVVLSRPLIRVFHDYPDKSVLLDVWRVDDFRGEAHGREGQPFQWVFPQQLMGFVFPEANRPIINAVRLPDEYLVTPESGEGESVFLERIRKALSCGIRLVQLRDKILPYDAYVKLAKKVLAVCREYKAQLLLNADPSLVSIVGADGVHLSSERLMSLSRRPLGRECWVAASCHNREEIAHAVAVDVDFAVLGPVSATQSHADVSPLGWTEFHNLADQAWFPVFALGGMKREDKEQAFLQGAQGIAAIRSLWPKA